MYFLRESLSAFGGTRFCTVRTCLQGHFLSVLPCKARQLAMASPSSSASRGEKFESDFAALNATIPRDRAREEKDRIIGFYEQKAEEVK